MKQVHILLNEIPYKVITTKDKDYYYMLCTSINHLNVSYPVKIQVSHAVIDTVQTPCNQPQKTTIIINNMDAPCSISYSDQRLIMQIQHISLQKITCPQTIFTQAMSLPEPQGISSPHSPPSSSEVRDLELYATSSLTSIRETEQDLSKETIVRCKYQLFQGHFQPFSKTTLRNPQHDLERGDF